jgi:hypothetical protein
MSVDARGPARGGISELRAGRRCTLAGPVGTHVRGAFDAWALFIRDPYHRLLDPRYGYGILMCCPDPIELRAMLEAIVSALPSKDARRLRAHLAHLDAHW